ncbi:MAG TPA: hypothetical protein VFV73_03430 [Streptosporangiaceae bacterium]|nr:hypothetical protein [Streptosporangiaceae bacterium]
MDVAALIAWLVTALGGSYLLGKWLAGGGVRGPTRFPVPVIFGHFLLAAAGLVVWIVFLLAHTKALAWTAFVILVPVALLGSTMFFRWIGVRRGARGTAAPVPAPARVGAPAAAGAPAPAAAGGAVPAERHLPVPVVLAHGVLAATTLVLVLLAALGV